VRRASGDRSGVRRALVLVLVVVLVLLLLLLLLLLGAGAGGEQGEAAQREHQTRACTWWLRRRVRGPAAAALARGEGHCTA
jgi:hypothetical protein